MMYDSEYTGKSYTLVIRNVLYLKRTDATLIPLFIMRASGVEINECPKLLAKKPTIKYHSIYVPEEDLRLH